MALIERQTTINAPVADVFTYLADFPRHSEWAAHSLQIQQTSEGPVGMGTTFTSVGHQMGRDHSDQVTITDFVPNSRIAFESVGEVGRMRHHFLLQEEGGGTRLTKGGEVLRAALLVKLLTPILRFMIPASFEGDLKRIKAKLEERSG